MSNFGGSKVRKARVASVSAVLRAFEAVHIVPSSWEYVFMRDGLIPSVWPPLAR
jgi:hypothetical protein